MPKRQPWDRRPDETDSQFLAFKCYRDLGLARTVRDAWDKYSDEKGLKSDKPTGAFEQWRKQNDWTERCRAFDRHVDRERQQTIHEARARARDKIAQRAGDLAEKLVAIALNIEEANKSQVKALKAALNRIGVSDSLEIDIDGTTGTKDRLREALGEIESKTTAELAQTYFEALEGGGEASG